MGARGSVPFSGVILLLEMHLGAQMLEAFSEA